MEKIIKRRKIVDVNPTPKTEPNPPIEKSTKQDPPKKQQQQKKKKWSYFDQFKGEYLVFQLKSGMLVEGIIEGEMGGFVTVTDAIILSKNYRAEVDWTRIDRAQIGHFHPKANKLIPIADIVKEESVNEKIPNWQKEAYREYTLNLIVELKESGKTLKEIAQALEQSGVKTRSGKDTWNVATISAILKNQ